MMLNNIWIIYSFVKVRGCVDIFVEMVFKLNDNFFFFNCFGSKRVIRIMVYNNVFYCFCGMCMCYNNYCIMLNIIF